MTVRSLLSMFAGLVFAAACGGGDDTDVPDVAYGETTFVVALNPAVNDVNERPVPAPGLVLENVTVSSDDGITDVTDLWGVAVLPRVTSGTRALALDSSTVGATVALEIDAGDLREVAITGDANRAEAMAVVVYAFAGEVVEVDPSMSVGAVNDALARSDTIVFFAGGTYTGDLQFSGSNVTLFGESPEGGRVFIDGNVTVGGSGNRIRGATISGDLTVPGSDVSVSFTRVEGLTTISGSSTVLLMNDLCGSASISGSGTTALGNLGIGPLGGC